MATTYEAIATYTIPSAQASYEFTSIPSTYTDLVVAFGGAGSSGSQSLTMNLNGDTGSNYSYSTVYTTGSSALSNRASNQSAAYVGYFFTAGYTMLVNIFNYANTSTYKTLISKSMDANAGVIVYGNLWRSTSAINAVKLNAVSNTFAAGTVITLYGIKAA
jgi:hypothetical protein